MAISYTTFVQSNARFWVFWRGSWVKITLTPSRPVVDMHASRATDEGFAAVHERYELTDNRVLSQLDTRGRDCDGPHEWHWEGYCLLDELRVPVDEYAMPLDSDDPGIRANWQRESCHQVDTYAEMAGY